MRNVLRFAVVAAFAGAIATVSFACDKDGARLAEHKDGGCAHADAAKVANALDEKPCGAHAAEAKAEGCAQAAKAKAEGCAQAAKAKAEGCAHATAEKADLSAYEDEAGGCPMHSKASEAQRAAILKAGEKVTLVGHVVCVSCDLKQAKECKSIFKTESGQSYSIVANDASEKLSAQTMHGEKKVEIVGTTVKAADESIVLLTSYKLIS